MMWYIITGTVSFWAGLIIGSTDERSRPPLVRPEPTPPKPPPAKRNVTPPVDAALRKLVTDVVKKEIGR